MKYLATCLHLSTKTLQLPFRTGRGELLWFANVSFRAATIPRVIWVTRLQKITEEFQLPRSVIWSNLKHCFFFVFFFQCDTTRLDHWPCAQRKSGEDGSALLAAVPRRWGFTLLQRVRATSGVNWHTDVKVRALLRSGFDWANVCSRRLLDGISR